MVKDSENMQEIDEREGAEGETDSPINWEAETAKFKDQWMRALAEVDNIRKRTTKEREDALKYGVTKLAQDLLSIADNLKRACENFPKECSVELEGIFSGIQLIEGELASTLERHGIKAINPIGELFDPHFHQAMFEAPATDETPPGHIFQVLQVGYMIHDRLLRPALVGVVKS